MLRLAEDREIYVVCGYTDMRNGIDGLVRILKSKYELDPFAQAIYLFCGRRADRFKAVYWDSDRGFVLIYVRLEDGHFRWPRTVQEARRITSEQYRRLLEGLQIEEKSTIKTVKRRDII